MYETWILGWSSVYLVLKLFDPTRDSVENAQKYNVLQIVSKSVDIYTSLQALEVLNKINMMEILQKRLIYVTSPDFI